MNNHFPVADPKMVQKILFRAAEILEAGWCQGALCQTPTGQSLEPSVGQPGVDRFCMAGAFTKARLEIYGPQETGRQPEEYLVATDLVRVQMPVGLFWGALGESKPGHVSVPYFNDKLCATAEQAAGVFRKAAEGLA